MTPAQLTLAADLLDLAADEFANHGCEDWDWPADWDLRARKALLDHMDLREDDRWYLVGSSGPPVSCAMRAVAEMLREEAGGHPKPPPSN